MTALHIATNVSPVHNPWYDDPADMVEWRRLCVERAASIGVPVPLLLSDDKKRRTCLARWECFALLRSRGWSLPRVGRALGKDHTTVINGLARLPWLRAYFAALDAPHRYHVSVGVRFVVVPADGIVEARAAARELLGVRDRFITSVRRIAA